MRMPPKNTRPRRSRAVVFRALVARVAARMISVVSSYFVVEERARHELYRRLL